MYRRLLGIIIGMTAFWAVILGASWALADVYRPFILAIAPGLFRGGWSDVVMWIGVVVLLGIILLLFKKLFYRLFWLQISRRGYR